jgi:EAL domain-containing protein (putative c-di-GMP-specific phosphodiesterase class I)
MLGMSAEGESVVGAIIALGRSLRLQLVAEGVETVAQARALLDSGCHAMQGFLFSPPVLAAQLPEVARSLSERCRSLVGPSTFPQRESASFACHGRIA